MTASGDITHAWVVIDSDGEDEPDANGLRETDIVCFLNQVPFGEIFRQVGIHLRFSFCNLIRQFCVPYFSNLHYLFILFDVEYIIVLFDVMANF